MTKGILSPFFPISQRDVSRLRQSATDAINDFGSTASAHAVNVRGRLRDLADHLRDESQTNLHRAKGRLDVLLAVTRDLTRRRPLTCLAGALTLGLLIGLCRRSMRNQ